MKTTRDRFMLFACIVATMLVWSTIILVFALPDRSIPTTTTVTGEPGSTIDLLSRKALAHGLAFGVLALLLYHCFVFATQERFPTELWTQSAFGLIILTAGFSEWLQIHSPGRNGSIDDALIDVLWSALTWWITFIIHEKIYERKWNINRLRLVEGGETYGIQR